MHLLPFLAPLATLLAALTMSLGNLVAILQKDLKRFFAYSSISQAGYIFMGFIAVDSLDIAAMVFYMAIYIVTNLTVLGVLYLHMRQTGQNSVESLAGFSRRNPILALVAMVGLFGLAGIPPLAGFVGKFFLFSVAAKSGYHWLVAVAAINSTISLYYYLRLVRQMYMEPNTLQPAPIKVKFYLRVLGLTLSVSSSIIMGLIPVFYERIYYDMGIWLSRLGLV